MTPAAAKPDHAGRKQRLECLLLTRQGLWRAQPFKEETPAWCPAHPDLTAALLALDEAEVARLAAQPSALAAWLVDYLPDLAALEPELAALERVPEIPAPAIDDPRFFRDVPGRKRVQIEAYAAALGAPAGPLLEWCAGKGHLGRLLAHVWHRPVVSLEIDPQLCAAGERLAAQAQLADWQHFLPADALAAASHAHLAGRHAVALHACGDLHRQLLLGAAAQRIPALDLAPCCYYKTRDPEYRPLSGGELRLGPDDLRLAVTETVTASAAERQASRRGQAWKLGWVELRGELAGEAAYRNFKPVPAAWLRLEFAEFGQRMARREGLPLPTPTQLAWAGRRGEARAGRMRRLELLRFAFRRPLEHWLLADMACYLENQGYQVRIAAFCPRPLTPRNLLLSARRED